MTDRTVRRRSVLAGLCGGTLLAGTSTGTAAKASEPARSIERNEARTETTIVVDSAGSDGNPGTMDEPVETIGEAVGRVQPGETIYVTPGEYQELVVIEQSGTPENPIELTGPPEAMLRCNPDTQAPAALVILGDHIHVTGLTIDGLADLDRSEDPDAYGDGPLIHHVGSGFELEDYAEGAVIAPHGVGNSGRQLVNLNFVKNAEIGPFRVTGRAGAKWQLTDEENHNGEIVYIGTARTNIEQIDDFDGWDRTQNIHVHHIDNSAGHPHHQLVDVKAGAENVTIEYCTDGGGSHNTQPWTANAVGLAGHRCTLRWCRLQNGEGDGVSVGRNAENDPDDDVGERAGTENEIYGNEITGFGNQSIAFPHVDSQSTQGPEGQAVICGNTVDEPTEGDPTRDCPADVPTSDGIGHDASEAEEVREVGLSEPPESDPSETDSSADAALYVATLLATGSLFVPYGLRRLRRQ